MTDEADKVTLKLHGLVSDNDQVRADVFVEKLRALVLALKTVDKISHGKPKHQFMIADLKIGSALATIREKTKRHGPVDGSTVGGLSDIVSAIYDGDLRVADRLPPRLITSLSNIATRNSKTFSHGEITFPSNKIIRIDEFFAERVEEIRMRVANDQVAVAPTLFRGTAYGTFDGMLKALDARGTVTRAALHLTVGGIELDCTVNTAEVHGVGDHFDQLVSVDAIAHYDGKRPLPVRLEIRSIRKKASPADLTPWIGALKPIDDDRDLDEDW